jgi:hypothetical protein
MKCKGISKSGKNCNTNAMNNGYCYFHNPDISKEEKRASLSKGGKSNKLIRVNSLFPEIKIKSAKDVTKLLSLMINKVMNNELDLRIATGITYITSHLLKAFEQTELNEKLDNIEEMINKLKGKEGGL